MIESIHIKSLRCHKDKKLTFTKGLNVIVGQNGVGKTTILEAINLIDNNTIFTGINSHEFIAYGDNKGEIEAELNVDNEKIKINLDVVPGRLRRGIDPKKFASVLNKLCTTISLCRNDFDLVGKENLMRRNYLDHGALILTGSPYKETIKNFKKTLIARNILLKQDSPDKKSLIIWTEIFDQLNVEIRNKRMEFIEVVRDLIPPLIEKIFGTARKFNLTYENSSKDDEGINFKNAIIRKSSLYGVQRDKVQLFVDNRNVVTQTSIGERKAIVYLLKTVIMLCSIEKKICPIFIIDDFNTELDKFRREKLLNYFLDNSSQIILSTTHHDRYDGSIVDKDYNIIDL